MSSDRLIPLRRLAAVAAVSVLWAGAAAAGSPEECVTEQVQFIEWTPAFAPSAREASRASLVEFALGLCELQLGEEDRATLLERYRFRSVAVQLRDGLRLWHEDPAREFAQYSLAAALMESRPGYQARLAPIVVDAFGAFLGERGASVLPEGDLRASLERVLERRFSGVAFEPVPGYGRARVLEERGIGHRLEIRAWPHPSELLFILFHELSHVSDERSERFARWSRSRTDESWIELGIFEEFRARALTAHFEAAWKRGYPQYGPAREPALGEIFERLRWELRPSLPDQAEAYSRFFKSWDALSPVERERKLALISSVNPSTMSR